MMLKSAPDVVFDLTARSLEYQSQKQMWLEEEKMAWLDKRRAEWEAQGKLIPLADWQELREYDWRVNELPNRELRWAQQLLEREKGRNV